MAGHDAVDHVASSGDRALLDSSNAGLAQAKTVLLTIPSKENSLSTPWVSVDEVIKTIDQHGRALVDHSLPGHGGTAFATTGGAHVNGLLTARTDTKACFKFNLGWWRGCRHDKREGRFASCCNWVDIRRRG